MKSNFKKLVTMVLVIVALFISTPMEKANAGQVADWNVARELVDGNWSPYATDFVKFHLNDNNTEIVSVEYTDPLGESKIWVNFIDENDGSRNQAAFTITYNPKTDKYEMRIKIQIIRYGFVEKKYVTDRKFVKVYWDNK